MSVREAAPPQPSEASSSSTSTLSGGETGQTEGVTIPIDYSTMQFNLEIPSSDLTLKHFHEDGMKNHESSMNRMICSIYAFLVKTGITKIEIHNRSEQPRWHMDRVMEYFKRDSGYGIMTYAGNTYIYLTAIFNEERAAAFIRENSYW